MLMHMNNLCEIMILLNTKMEEEYSDVIVETKKGKELLSKSAERIYNHIQSIQRELDDINKLA